VNNEFTCKNTIPIKITVEIPSTQACLDMGSKKRFTIIGFKMLHYGYICRNLTKTRNPFFYKKIPTVKNLIFFKITVKSRFLLPKKGKFPQIPP